MVTLYEPSTDLKFSIAPDEKESQYGDYSEDQTEIEKGLTTKQIKNTAEVLVKDLDAYFGSKLKERIFRNTEKDGKLQLIFNDGGNVYGENGLVLLTSNSIPYTENTLRQPWKSIENNFEKSCLSVQIEKKIEPKKKPRKATRFKINTEENKKATIPPVSEGDLDFMTIADIKKTSTYIEPNNVLDDEGKIAVIKNDEGEVTEDMHSMFNKMKALVAAGLARGMKIKKFDVDGSSKFTMGMNPVDVRKMSPERIVNLYKRMYTGGSAEGGDINSLSILHEDAQNTIISPEDILMKREIKDEAERELFEEKKEKPKKIRYIAQIDYPEKNSLKGMHPPEKNLAQDLIEPAVEEINDQIEKFNSYQHEKQSPYRYRKIKPGDPGDMNEIVNSTLYKDIDVLDKLHKKYPDPNLIPLVLSDDVLVFRGQRGVDTEDTLVLLKDEEGNWNSRFFFNSEDVDRRGRNLDERIDDWIQKSNS